MFSCIVPKGFIHSCIMGVLFFISTTALGAYNILNAVPHVHEFGTENPGGISYYWCGQTALKVAMKYRTGVNKTLSEINDVFKNNSQGFKNDTYCGSENPGKHWCAKLQDLLWAARLSQYGGYGRSSIDPNITQYTTATSMYTGIKSAINSGYPVIMPSNVAYRIAGHFWVIVGYSDGYNDATNTIYVRDVAMSNPVNSLYDRTFFASEFFNASYRQALIIK